MTSVWSGGTRSDVRFRCLWEGGQENAEMTLAGIYEKRPAVRYFDTGPARAAIDAATTIQQLQDAIAPIAAHSSATIHLQQTSTNYMNYILSPVSVDHPRLKPFLRYMVDSLAQLQAGKIADGDPVVFRIGSTLKYGSNTAVSGVAFNEAMTVYYSVEQTPFHFQTVGSADNRAHPGVFMHELGHLIEYKTRGTAIHSAMDTGLRNANPPGFTYSADVADDPFTRDHPEGFLRGYGRSNREEDFADMVAYMTVPALYVDLVRWMQSDPYLVKKHNVLQQFLANVGWGTYAIEQMHGHVPQVHPL